MAYTPSVLFGNSSVQFYFTLPNSSGLPANDGYWAVVKDSNSDFYLMPFTSSANWSCSGIATKNVSNGSDLFDSDIDFTQGNSFYYKLSTIGSYSSSNRRFTANFRRPIVANTTDISAICSTVSTYSSFASTNIFFINSYIEEESTPTGGSCDITPLVPAILMIPATLIVLATFTIIYKMFMNRKVRG